MIRLLISAALRLGANALGLLVADAILDDMSIEWKGFIVAVLIFTGVQVLIEPLMMKIALTSAPVLRGSVALVAVLIGLIVTDVFFDGVSISGFTTWALATVIVWLAAMLAAFILPLIFLRNQRESAKLQPRRWQHVGSLIHTRHSELSARSRPAPSQARFHSTMQNDELNGHDPSVLDRRRALRMLGGAGLGVGLVAVGLDLAKVASAASGADSTIPTATEEIPDETGGPFPADGTNGVNALSEDGVVRSDITSSFGAATGVADGVPLQVVLNVQDLADGETR